MLVTLISGSIQQFNNVVKWKRLTENYSLLSYVTALRDWSSTFVLYIVVRVTNKIKTSNNHVNVNLHKHKTQAHAQTKNKRNKHMHTHTNTHTHTLT